MAHRSGGPPKDPETLRRWLLEATRALDVAWVDVGAGCVEVDRQGLWEAWGYKSFRSFASVELKLMPSIINHFVDGFLFLERRAPELLSAPAGERSIPSLEYVKALAKAEKQGRLTDKEFSSMRETIWKDDKPPAEKIRETLGKLPPAEPVVQPSNYVAFKLLGLVNRVLKELDEVEDVPRSLREHAKGLAEGLERLARKNQRAEAPVEV